MSRSIFAPVLTAWPELGWFAHKASSAFGAAWRATVSRPAGAVARALRLPEVWKFLTPVHRHSYLIFLVCASAAVPWALARHPPSALLRLRPETAPWAPPPGADWWIGAWVTLLAVSVLFFCWASRAKSIRAVLRAAGAGVMLTLLCFAAAWITARLLFQVDWADPALAARIARHWIEGGPLRWHVPGVLALALLPVPVAFACAVAAPGPTLRALTAGIVLVTRRVMAFTPFALCVAGFFWVTGTGWRPAVAQVESLYLRLVALLHRWSLDLGLPAEEAPRWVWFAAGAVVCWLLLSVGGLLLSFLAARLEHVNAAITRQRLGLGRPTVASDGTRGELGVDSASERAALDDAYAEAAFREAQARTSAQIQALKRQEAALGEREAWLRRQIEAEQAAAPTGAPEPTAATLSDAERPAEESTTGGAGAAETPAGADAVGETPAGTGDVSSTDSTSGSAATDTADVSGGSEDPVPTEASQAEPSSAIEALLAGSAGEARGDGDDAGATGDDASQGDDPALQAAETTEDSAKPPVRKDPPAARTSTDPEAERNLLRTKLMDEAYRVAQETMPTPLSDDLSREEQDVVSPDDDSVIDDDDDWGSDFSPEDIPGDFSDPSASSHVKPADKPVDPYRPRDMVPAKPSGVEQGIAFNEHYRDVLEALVDSRMQGTEPSPAEQAQEDAAEALVREAADAEDSRDAGTSTRPAATGASPAPADEPAARSADGSDESGDVPQRPAPDPTPEPSRPAEPAQRPAPRPAAEAPAARPRPAPAERPTGALHLPAPDWTMYRAPTGSSLDSPLYWEYRAGDFTFMQTATAPLDAAGSTIDLLSGVASRFDLRTLAAQRLEVRDRFPNLCALVADSLLDPETYDGVKARLEGDLTRRSDAAFHALDSVSAHLMEHADPQLRRAGHLAASFMAQLRPDRP